MKRHQGAMGTAGLIVSILAILLVATSGAAYAAALITTKNIKNGAVTAPKLANNSVTSAKVKKGLLHDQVTGWVTQPEWLAWS